MCVCVCVWFTTALVPCVYGIHLPTYSVQNVPRVSKSKSYHTRKSAAPIHPQQAPLREFVLPPHEALSSLQARLDQQQQAVRRTAAVVNDLLQQPPIYPIVPPGHTDPSMEGVCMNVHSYLYIPMYMYVPVYVCVLCMYFYVQVHTWVWFTLYIRAYVYVIIRMCIRTHVNVMYIEQSLFLSREIETILS